MPGPTDYSHLLPYCKTKRQRDAVEAHIKHGTGDKAAAALGINLRTFHDHIARVKAHYGKASKDAHVGGAVPEGFGIHGASTFTKDAEGNPQWIKTSVDKARQKELMEEAIRAMTDDLPRLPRRKAEKRKYRRDLMACYPIGDAHIGMYSWHEETGEDWDLAIAETVQCGAMAELVDMAPHTETATIINLGDWFHYDSLEPKTSRSGHMLDSDGRYAKMLHVGIKVMRQCIESALEKHKRVHIINVIGNHDDTGAMWLTAALLNTYEREPRVTIESAPSAFMYFRFGANLVGCHHGNSCKPNDLPGVMATDRAKEWGDTTHRYWWIGHVHHQSVKEFQGCSVESFNTLAAKDAWATAGGYRARRNMKCIVLHETGGEHVRFTLDVGRLKP